MPDSHTPQYRVAMSTSGRSNSHSLPFPRRSRSDAASVPLPGIRRQSTLQSLGLRRRSDVEIVLNDRNNSVSSYSTRDEIAGNVVLRFEKDTVVDDMTVSLEGVALTYVEKIATTAPTTGRTTGRHTFLRLQQPIDVASLPPNRLARAGEMYEIPFTFTVPERLLPQVCSHSVDNDMVKQAHLCLPPSLGEPVVTADGLSLLDDLAPDMAKITYRVRVRVAKRDPNATGGRSHVGIEDKTVKVRIIPEHEEEPPLNVEADNLDYVLRREKNVRRGMFKLGKIGKMTAETTQPRSLRLPPPRKRRNDSTSGKTEADEEPVTTMTAINFRFDALTPDEEPPQLASIVCKLRAQTFFGAAPYRELPVMSQVNAWDTMRGHYPDSLELSSRNLSTVAWTKHSGEDSEEESNDTGARDIARRPSVFSTMSTASIPEPSTAYQPGMPFWTASVLVPISLPKNKAFVPSFHACIVSRVYALEFSISYKGANVGNSSLMLKVPLQISSQGDPTSAAHVEAEAAIAREIERQFFSYSTAQAASGSPAAAAMAEGAINNSNSDNEPHSPLSLLSPLSPRAPVYTEPPEYNHPTNAPRHHSIATMPIRAAPSAMPTVAEGAFPSGLAPPEYHSGLGRIRESGRPRTQNVRYRALRSTTRSLLTQWV